MSTPVNPEVIARKRTLELALARAGADLRTATQPAHRKMLTDAIAALEAQLAELK